MIFRNWNPLIAKQTSPGNVVKVRDIEGMDVAQCYVGSSANPGWRDFAIAAEIVRGKCVPAPVFFDINPTSRELLDQLITDGRLGALVAAGARIHQAGCNGCIGMGQAPATVENSLRTTPRNPRAIGYKRRFGVSLLSGNSGGLRLKRKDHRSAPFSLVGEVVGTRHQQTGLFGRRWLPDGDAARSTKRRTIGNCELRDLGRRSRTLGFEGADFYQYPSPSCLAAAAARCLSTAAAALRLIRTRNCRSSSSVGRKSTDVSSSR